ncbi:uncharacterized protein [Montipora foliosa]|uniref:uncharacterized protein n=1 Tax=Montipora foliosa TaxID=591990 RepID=UPI0035F14436
MEFLNAVFLVVSFCSLMNRFTEAVCQDHNKLCSQYANDRYCKEYDNIKTQCSLSCQLCGNNSNSTSNSPLTSATSSQTRSQGPLSSSPGTRLTSSSFPTKTPSTLSPFILATASSFSSMAAAYDLTALLSSTASLQSSVLGNEDKAQNKSNTEKASAPKTNISHTKIIMVTGFAWIFCLGRL